MKSKKPSRPGSALQNNADEALIEQYELSRAERLALDARKEAMRAPSAAPSQSKSYLGSRLPGSS